MPSVSSLTTADVALLVQLSDSHLFAEAEASLLGMNTRDSLRAVIDLVLKQQPNIDLMLATGDLSRTARCNPMRRFGN